ncbi:hypothetical protein E2C01_088369 [Portunus trituberculatus]|uniref:Uncharacterized protein n=1 Tax=Portunus trituberculatus TaxID=210409 RepID=A0A5B7JGE6_PORTR|nr:hypothetical protein [Portunus trituberculatus]
MSTESSRRRIVEEVSRFRDTPASKQPDPRRQALGHLGQYRERGGRRSELP